MPTSRSNRVILITIGDPSGVGPEVALKALASPEVRALADFFIIGDASIIEKAKRDLGLKISPPVLDLANVDPKSFSYGKSRADFGKASLEYIDSALGLLRRGYADALVTAPVCKRSITMALASSRITNHESRTTKFEGHTEYLAEKTGTKKYAMMFVGERLKITLVTRHIALRDVAKTVSVESVCDAILLTHKYLKSYFKVRNPRIGVAGINPHAGEGGLFGDEERRVISPAIKKSLKYIKDVFGPVPPDVIFNQAFSGKFDACIAIYHDQALIPFKLLYFTSGVNLTLGLPFVRTSPDHGTAFDIAGKGAADPRSMIEAIRLAVNPSTYPSLKAEGCSGLTLSKAATRPRRRVKCLIRPN